MGLISRVSSRTYRVNYGCRLENLPDSPQQCHFRPRQRKYFGKGRCPCGFVRNLQILSIVLQARLSETGKNKERIEVGRFMSQSATKVVKYEKSELRLIETLEGDKKQDIKPVCDRLLEYNMHKEREGSLRFSKGRSQTMDTLQGLVDKGVKVDLGIPLDSGMN